MKEEKKRKSSLTRDTWHRLKKNKLAIIGLIVLALTTFISILSPLIAPYDYSDQDLKNILEPPNWSHLFGTDNFGRDILSRIIVGSRVSLLVGFSTVMLSASIGSILGILAAYYKFLEDIIMRFIDILSGVPNLLLAIAIAAALGTGIRNMIMAISIAAIPKYARIMRATVLTIKEQEFIEAIRSIGANDSRIILRHILPNALSPILVQSTLGMATAIISSATLSFLGLGIQPPSPEWGAMLSVGRDYLRQAWFMAFFPGIAIVIVAYALNLLGDGLRDSLDPRLKK